jgi:hypothetical protein
MAAACPSNPPAPSGFSVWTGAVPAELSRWAVALLKHINEAPYGTVWSTTYQGQPVLARKDYHTWTYRNGELVSGICIPGITLYQPTFGLTNASYTLPAGTIETSLDGSPSERTFSPGAFTGAALALAGVVGLFLLGMKLAGTKGS